MRTFLARSFCVTLVQHVHLRYTQALLVLLKYMEGYIVMLLKQAGRSIYRPAPLAYLILG